METVQRVARNTGVIILGNIVEKIIGIVTIIFLARYLGASGFGIYSFIFAYLGFFSIITDLGINQILVREISRERIRADRLIGNAIIMKVTLSLFTLALACLIISFLNYPFNTKLLVYVASLSLLLSFGSLYRLIFQVDLRMQYPIVADILNGSAKLALFLYLIFLKVTLFWFIIAGIVTVLPGILLLWHLSKKSVRPRFEINLKIWKEILKESWPLALTATFIMIYVRIDQLMLFQMKGAEAVGHYAAAVRLTEVFGIIPAAFMASVFPLFSKYFVTSGEKLEKAYRLSFKYLATAILPIAVGTCILSEPIVMAIYGNQFLNSISALRILIWSEIFVFLGAIHISILISVGLQRLDFIFTSSSAIANIILNLLLIPRYGIVGAATATVISYGLGVPLSCALRKTRRYGLALVFSTLKPFAAAILMGCFTYFLFFLHLPIIAIILLSSLIYLGLIILIRGLDAQDFRYFKKIMVWTREETL